MNEPIITKRPKKRKQTKSKQFGLTLFTLVLMSLIIFGAYKFFFPAEEEFVLDFYTYAIVDTRDFLEALSASGTVKPELLLAIKPEVDATIIEVFAIEGQDVQQGDPLIRLHSDIIVEQHEKITINLAQAKQQLIETIEEHKFKLSEIEQEVEDTKALVNDKAENLELQILLYEFGTIARVDLEKAEKDLLDAQRSLLLAERKLQTTLKNQENELEKANELVRTTEEELAMINQQLEHFLVTAPISGRILEFDATINEDATKSKSLGQIADLNTQFVEINITAAQAERFQLGSVAHIVTGQSTYAGEVSYISAQARESSDGSMVTVRIAFNEPVKNLRPYSSVTANIHLGIYKNSLFLPRGAYLTSGQQLFVYKVDGDRAVQQDVQFGLLQGNYIQIFSGLAIGDKVITSSYDQYRHLEEIKILPEGGRKI